MGIFSKGIIKTEIVDHINGLDENEELMNLFVGHNEGGFGGMVTAQVYNQYNFSKTIFKVYYSNGSNSLITVLDNSSDYNYYIKFLGE